MADIYGTIESLARSVQDSLTSKTIYGEPITAGAVTVVPVAEVRFGFGGGGGGAEPARPPKTVWPTPEAAVMVAVAEGAA